MFGFWGGNVFDIKDARHDLVDVPSRPRSRLMNAYSGTKLATARNRLRSLSADGVQWVLQEHLPGHVGLCVGSDTYCPPALASFTLLIKCKPSPKNIL